MKTLLSTTLILGALFIGGTTTAQPKILRAGEMSSQQWSELTASDSQDIIVEFRQGDEIPVSFTSEGDLIETVQTGVSYIKVKKSFWLQLQNDNVKISLNGVSFKNLNDVIRGSFSAGASANTPGIPVNSIHLMLKAFLK